MWEETTFELDVEKWGRSQVALEMKSARCPKRALVMSKTLKMGKKHIPEIQSSRNRK